MDHSFVSCTPRFVVHNLGETVRDWRGTRSERIGASVAKYDVLADVPGAVDRAQFEWMLANGELVTQCGDTVYQVQRSA